MNFNFACRFGIDLESIWGLGRVLGGSWEGLVAVFERSWRVLGPSWGRLVACLGVDLGGFVTEGQASWADVLQPSANHAERKQGRG